MEKLGSSKEDILIDNFINRYTLKGVFNKSEFEELLAKSIISENRELRRVSCKIVRRLRLQNFLSYVRVLLNDEDFVIKSLALLAVAQFRDYQSVEKIVELHNDENKLVKASVVLALGSIDEPKTYNLIFDSLNDKSEEVRENAIVALSWINYQQAYKKLIQLYETENNKNLKNRIIKAFSILPRELVVEKLKEIVFKENDNVLILSALNSLYKKGISAYNILADTIILKAINDVLKNGKEDLLRKNLYTIASHTLWEIKGINEDNQKKIYKFIEEDLFLKYYMKSEEVKRLAVSSLKNLSSKYHQWIIKIFEYELSSSLKIDIINFLSNPRVDKNFKILLLEFIKDEDKFIKEQALFALLDGNYPKSILSFINQKIYSMEYSYLKLIILAILYNEFNSGNI
ncbi:MAG: HEAT repeat domain-containing protein [bacterium]